MIQKKIQKKRINNEIDDVFIFVEHNPVITIGRAGGYEHLKVTENILAERGIQLHYVDRGGSITIHEPGQLVIYPIINLELVGNDLIRHLYMLEESTILVLNKLGIHSAREKKNTGVWVHQSKIASIGVSSRSGVTRHGMALNVNNEVDIFNLINPCGLTNCSVTSISKVLKKEVAMSKIKNFMIDALEKTFCVKIKKIALDLLL